jgi:small subunit ribosomal protein S17
MPKKVAVGVVTSDKMDKTRRVEIHRKVPHPVYGKYIRKRTVCFVHDEENESNAGDTVEIIEAAPRSKQKRWDLVRIVTRTTEVDLAAMRLADAVDKEDAEAAQSESTKAAAEEAAVEEVAAEEAVVEEVATEETASQEVVAEETTSEEVAEEAASDEDAGGEETADDDGEEISEE